jgi:hypothetical protein
MPTHDYIIANGTGAAVRADINLALSAIVSLNSSASEPATMYAYQLWADTALGLLKIRNGANSAWITLRQLDGDFSIVAVEDGLQATPSLTFTNDLNTGVFRSGADALAIVTGGQYAIACTSTQAVGIKTANPSTALHVAGNARVGADDVTDAHLQIGKGATGNRNSYIDIVGDTTYTDYGLRVIRNNTGANATSELKHRGTGALNFTTEEAAPIVFNTTNSPALTILAGGNVGIGTSTPTNTSKLEIQTSSTTAPGLWVQTGGTTSAYPIVDVRNGANLDVFAIKGDGTSYFQGKLGIGTTSPAQKLEIQNGSISIGSSSNDNATNVLVAGYGYILSGTKYGNTSIRSTYSNANNAASLEFYVASSGANTDERMRLDSDGRLLVGTTSVVNDYWLGGAQSIQSAKNSLNGILVYTATAFAPGHGSFLGLHRANGTMASPAIVANGDTLGAVYFGGYDGSTYLRSAAIDCVVDGAPGANDMPSRLVFSTTADEASSPTERMRITSYGTFLASNAGSYPTTTGTYHAFSANSPDDLILRLNNTSSTNPYGVNVVFDAAAPNDTTRFFLNCADNAALRATIRSNGGLANYSANNANLSDRNVKKDISPAANTWNCIKEWEIVNYRYKDQPDDADLNLGVIAQQVAESCPEVITIFQEAKEATEDKPAQEERLGVKEQQMYWMAIKALQEAMGRIEQLETKVAALESA